MKTRKNLVSIICVILICFLVEPAKVFATENPSNSVEILIKMQALENTPNDSCDGSFYFVNSDSEYMMAQYQKETNSYVVIGFTDDPLQATAFQFSSIEPTVIHIDGIPNGKYVWKEENIPTGYIGLGDIQIEFKNEEMIVQNRVFTEENGLFKVEVVYNGPFYLPDVCENCKEERFLQKVGTVLVISMSALLIGLGFMKYREKTPKN